MLVFNQPIYACGFGDERCLYSFVFLVLNRIIFNFPLKRRNFLIYCFCFNFFCSFPRYYKQQSPWFAASSRLRTRGGTPLYGYTRAQKGLYWGMCGLKGYGFSVINRVSILPDFGHFCYNWGTVFVPSSLYMGVFLRRSHFFIKVQQKIS